MMISESSIFNHNYEGCVVAATGPGRQSAWGALAEKFSIDAKKPPRLPHLYRSTSYRHSSSSRFSIIGLFMNPGEMANNTAGRDYRSSLAARLVALRPHAPDTASKRSVAVPVSQLLNEFTGPRAGSGTLKVIRSRTEKSQTTLGIDTNNATQLSSAVHHLSSQK